MLFDNYTSVVSTGAKDKPWNQLVGQRINRSSFVMLWNFPWKKNPITGCETEGMGSSVRVNT